MDGLRDSSFDGELLAIQVRMEAETLKREIEQLTAAHICRDCGAIAEANVNGVPYCASCYYEHTGSRQSGDCFYGE